MSLVWDNDKNILSVYGDKVTLNIEGQDNSEVMALPFYEAFTTAYEKQYSKFVQNAQYYKLKWGADADADDMFKYSGHVVASDIYDENFNADLADIRYSANAKEWDTYTINMDLVREGAGIPIDAEYHFYGVYPATEEQVPSFTLRFASLLGDAKDVKTKAENYTSNNVTREVILTDEYFTLTDALDNTFYLFDGVKADGNIDKRSDMNQRQGFEEDTEGFATDFVLASEETTINAYYYKEDGKKQSLGVTIGKELKRENGVVKGDGAALYTNDNTKTRTWLPGDVTEDSKDNVIITNLRAVEADKPNGYAAMPGGIMIQLPSSIGTTEPVTIEFELEDVFGVTKTLSVTVKAAK